MDRFWLGRYPPGVPADIDPSVYLTIVALLEESFAKFRDRKAYVCMDKAITFGDLDALSKALAAWLQGRGLGKGARVAIMMPNVLQYPVAVAAVLRAGFVAVNVNPLYTARELEHQLRDSGAEAVIVLENFASTLQQAVASGKHPIRHVVVAAMGDLLGFPKLFVVRKDPALTRETLAGYCARQLTGYKRPKVIEFRDDLPKTNVGKILRRELRDSILKKAA